MRNERSLYMIPGDVPLYPGTSTTVCATRCTTSAALRVRHCMYHDVWPHVRRDMLYLSAWRLHNKPENSAIIVKPTSGLHVDYLWLFALWQPPAGLWQRTTSTRL